MPLPSDACADDPICCSLIFETAQRILDIVWVGLKPCYFADCDDCTTPLRRYVTMGAGDDMVADSLTVAFQGTTTSPKSTAAAGTTVGFPLHRGRFDVRLREEGWPLPGTSGPPDPDQQQAAAMHAYSHGEKLYRLVRNLAYTRNLTPADRPQLTNVIVGDLRALNPQGGVVGFAVDLSCDLLFNVAS